MGEVTGISWTDHTFNPWWGCTKVSAGCDNCYAESFDKRVGGAHWGKGMPRRVFGDKHWNEPLKWDRMAEKEGRKHMVFCASMADVMDDEAPEGQRERLWKLIDATPNLIWQLLTKRPQRYERYLPGVFLHQNVWLGTTAEDQPNYDLRAPIVRAIARERNLLWWISYEPAIGPLLMHCRWCYAGQLHSPDICDYPDWIIFGGESGANRRECKREWASQLFAQCRAAQRQVFHEANGRINSGTRESCNSA
jgi:protein gp37